jgi:lysozyme
MPHTNDAGLELIKSAEGLRLRAYPDPGTGGDPWTIAYGHTASVHPGEVCSPEQATEWLRNDVAAAEHAVATLVTVQLTANQFSALVSFAYNVGTGNFASSTLLHCVNEKAFANAALQFGRWVYAGGAAMPGLVTRRAQEAKLFATPG